MRKLINWIKWKFRKKNNIQTKSLRVHYHPEVKFDYSGIQKIAKDYVEPIKKKREEKKEVIYFTELAVLVSLERNEKLFKLDVSKIECNFRNEKDFNEFEKYLLGLYGYSYKDYRIDFEIQSKYV